VHQQTITVGEEEASRSTVLRQKQTLCKPSIPGTLVWRRVRLCRCAQAGHEKGAAQPACDANLQIARKGWALCCSLNSNVANREYFEPAGHREQSRLQCQGGLLTGYSLTSQLQGALTSCRDLSAVAAGNEVQLLRQDKPGYAGFALPMWGRAWCRSVIVRGAQREKEVLCRTGPSPL
jgi:hypothetical protein